MSATAASPWAVAVRYPGPDGLVTISEPLRSVAASEAPAVFEVSYPTPSYPVDLIRSYDGQLYRPRSAGIYANDGSGDQVVHHVTAEELFGGEATPVSGSQDNPGTHGYWTAWVNAAAGRTLIVDGFVYEKCDEPFYVVELNDGTSAGPVALALQESPHATSRLTFRVDQRDLALETAAQYSTDGIDRLPVVTVLDSTFVRRPKLTQRVFDARMRLMDIAEILALHAGSGDVATLSEVVDAVNLAHADLLVELAAAEHDPGVAQ